MYANGTEFPSREEGLEINIVDDGYVVYQPNRDKLHYLNHIAGLILELRLQACCAMSTKCRRIRPRRPRKGLSYCASYAQARGRRISIYRCHSACLLCCASGWRCVCTSDSFARQLSLWDWRYTDRATERPNGGARTRIMVRQAGALLARPSRARRQWLRLNAAAMQTCGSWRISAVWPAIPQASRDSLLHRRNR